MIELVLADACIRCDACVRVCPNDVFDTDTAGVAVIARQEDCVTCYLCEAWCPADALYVSPLRTPEDNLDEAAVRQSGVLGSFRRSLGWDRRRPGARGVDSPESALPAFVFSLERAVGAHRLK